MAPVKKVVRMEDGRQVEFVGAKKRLIKNTSIAEDGTISSVFDFVNGKTLPFVCPAALILNFAAHGVDQKLGDTIAGVPDIDDAVLAMETAIIRLNAGEWAAKRESNGMAGASVLLKALVEYSGKTVDAIKGYLSGKTQAQKLALRTDPGIKVIVDRIEAEKAANKPGIDTTEMLAGLNDL